MKRTLTLLWLACPLLLTAQAPPCHMLKNIVTNDDCPAMKYFAELTHAGDKLFFAGSTCSESPEVYALKIGEDSVFLPRNVWDEAAYGLDPPWCGIHPMWDFDRPRHLTAVGERVYYVIYNSRYGNEIWVTDGTFAGTALIRDIFAGRGTSSPAELTAFKGALWFVATSDVLGRKLWRSDGTPEGTIAAEVVTGASGATPSNLCVLGDELFFMMTAGDDRWLCKTDGTLAGTLPHLSFEALYAEGFVPVGLYSAGGHLLLTTWNDSAMLSRLYLADAGVPELTLLLETSASNGSIFAVPFNFQTLGNTILFSATTTGYGRELWRTDGTQAGTMLVKDLNPGAASSFPSWFNVLGDKMYFLAWSEGKRQLFVTDGTEQGTGLATIDPSPPADIYFLRANNGHLFFAGLPSTGLWRSDGETAEVVAPVQLIYDVVSVESKFYFLGWNSHHRGVWKWGGRAGEMAEPVNTLGRYDGSATPSAFTLMGGQAYFCTPEYRNDQQIWRTDGSTTGTIPITNTSPLAYDVASPILLPIGDSLLLFSARDPQHGLEPWGTNGEPGQERMIIDLNPGPGNSISHFFLTDGRLGYWSRSDQAGFYRTDGTAAGTFPISLSAGNPRDLLVFDGATYIRVSQGGQEWLMRTDGTAEGTEMVMPLNPGPWTPNIAVFDNRLWFFHRGEDNHWGLWHLDRAASEPQFALPLNPPGSGAPSTLMTDGASLFFFANHGIGGYRFYVSDGTPAGTRLFPDPGAAARPAIDAKQVAFWRGKVYFVFHHPEYGTELFVSDGTLEGTTLLADIMPGPESSWPGDLGLGYTDSLLFFSAFTGEFGRELWQTDGTPEGTVMVQDICPGPCSSTPYNLRMLDSSRLLFMAYAPGSGSEPWIYHIGVDSAAAPPGSPSPELGRLLVFPNPAVGGFVNLHFSENLGGRRVELYDLRGVRLFSARLAEGIADRYELALPDLSNGLYALCLLDERGRLLATEKLLIMKH
jgi:ELWxxDGT repeat protein